MVERGRSPQAERRRAQRVVLQRLLREVREERGFSQQVLADRIGVNQTGISKIELGEKRLDILELRDICAALGVPIDEFMRRLEARL